PLVPAAPNRELGDLRRTDAPPAHRVLRDCPLESGRTEWGKRIMGYVGQRITGLRNKQLVAGKGTFVGDIDLPGMTYMAVLRSPFAHARIRSVDTSAATAIAGVLAVVTGADIAAETDAIPEAWDPAEVGAKSI